VRFFLRRPPSTLDVLEHVMHVDDPERKGDEAEYPTWVPRWFEPRVYNIMSHACFSSGLSKGRRFSAQVHDNALGAIPRSPRVLSLDGYTVDIVRGTSDPLHLADTDGEACLRALEQAWLELFPFPMTPSPSRRYRDGQSLDLAFCKAVSAHPLGSHLAGTPAARAPRRAHARTDSSASLDDASLDPAVQMAQRDGEARIARYLEQFHGFRAGERERRPKPQTFLHAPFAPGPEAERFLAGARRFGSGRCVFVTSEGRLGLGPHVARPGDVVAVLFGGRTPFILRERAGQHLLLGQCVLVDDDVMFGRTTGLARRDDGGSGPASGPTKVTFHLR
jgi:hypothetical protein